MLKPKIEQLYEYFGLTPMDRMTPLAEKIEYIAKFMSDLEGDDVFRMLAKYDFDGASADRVSAVWRKIRFGEISKQTVENLSRASNLPVEGTLAPSPVQLATQSVSNVLSLPRGITSWSIE